MTQKTQMIGIGLRKRRHIYWSEGYREGSMDVLGKGGFGKMAASAAAPPGTAGPGKHSHLHFQPIYTHSPTYFHSNPCAFTLEQSHLHFTWPWGRYCDIVISQVGQQAVPISGGPIWHKHGSMGDEEIAILTNVVIWREASDRIMYFVLNEL